MDRIRTSPRLFRYIVMPYCAEDSLAVRPRREGRIPWPETMRIGGANRPTHEAPVATVEALDFS